MLGVIKQLTSHELTEGEIPDELNKCSISVNISIGLENSDCEGLFYLEVTTIDWFKKINRPIWGQRSLIVSQFDWQVIRQEIDQLLTQCSGDSWEEIVGKLGYFLERGCDL